MTDAGSARVLPGWPVETGNAIQSSPAVANGVVYVGSEDGYLYAYDAVSAAKLWTTATGNAIWSSPAVANGMVYIGSYDFSLYAYALNAGNDAVYRGKHKLIDKKVAAGGKSLPP